MRLGVFAIALHVDFSPCDTLLGPGSELVERGSLSGRTLAHSNLVAVD